MTAFMLKPFEDRVEILSDGAFYNDEGVLTHIGYKVLRVPFVPMAIVGSGAVHFVRDMVRPIVKLAMKYRSADAAIDILAEGLAEMSPDTLAQTPVNIAIAAISESLGPSCFVFSTLASTSSPIPALELWHMPTGVGQGPSVEADLKPAMADAGLTENDVETGLETTGILAFNLMRQKKAPNPADLTKPHVHGIGGQLDLTVLRAGGCERRTLLTWPDVIGQTINPFSQEVEAA